MTCDVWHATPDMWHVTCDMWHMGGWTFSRHFGCLALTLWDFWCFEDLEGKDHWLI